MATSEVTICNLALSWLAGNLIISLDDEGTEAQLCKANYELSRDAVLEAMAWTFATRRYALPSESITPAWGYDYQFTIPPEILVILDVTDDKATPNGANNLDWRREGNLILCDIKTVYVKAIYREADPARYTPNFIQAVAARIAAEIAIPLTESVDVMRMMEGKYKDRLAIAAATDGMQGKVDVLDARKLTGVRL